MVLSESVFLPFRVLPYITIHCLSLRIQPLTFSMAIHYTRMPFSLITKLFGHSNSLSYDLVVFELSLINRAIRYHDLSLTALLPSDELTFIVRTVLINLFTQSMLTPVDPSPHIFYIMLFTLVRSLPKWFIICPFTLIIISIFVYHSTSSVSQSISPLTFIKETLFVHHYSFPIAF